VSASRICIGGSVIETEPVAQRCRANKAASARRSILPVSFLGNAEAIRITLGTLKSAKRVRQNACSRSASVSPLSTPAAQTSSPIVDALRERSLGTLTDKYRSIGTVANLAVFDRLGTLPTHNFQCSTFDDAEALSGETLTESHFSRRHGCASCTIRCERLFRSLRGEEQRLEYETLFALGPLCEIRDPETVLEAARLCDLYGMDTISTGGTLAWAMECGERGLLPETRQLGLGFGRPEGILAAIPLIAAREGIGALLAEGSRRAALDVGGESVLGHAREGHGAAGL